MSNYHIGQVNIGRVRGPLDSATRNATYFRPYPEDDRILLNMSVWESIEALRHYTYKTVHAELLRQRHDWFDKFESSYLALWWVPIGHIPGIDEAKKRLAHLDAHGPTQFAFTFKRTFDPDEEFQSGVDWTSFVPCPAA